MEQQRTLHCQVCLTSFNWISGFKKHVRSKEHRKKMGEVFQKDKFKGNGFFPSVKLVGAKAKCDSGTIIGLSLLTLCFSQDAQNSFYLCHVCEEKVSSDRITHHVCSRDHCSNYFNYTDPDVLSFAWVPSMDMRVILEARLTKEEKEEGPGQLQVRTWSPGILNMLDLPKNLLQKFERCIYSEVMGTLSENDKLVKLLEAARPKRMMIQTYQRDSNRKHPLLGMQHVVECICAGSTERRYYLCTLCNLTLATHMIIRHVLSFDHISSYFKAWHPSTLLSKECYGDYTESFASMILDFAKQTEEIHGTANSDMKQVILQPAIFKSVNFTSYTNALKELKSITKDESLVTNIKPGNKLVMKEQESIKKGDNKRSLNTSMEPGNKLVMKEQESIKKGDNKRSLNTSMEPGNKLVMKEQESIKKGDNKRSLNTSMEPGNKPECHTVSAESASSYKLRCQNCSVVFETIYQYVNHLSKRQHKEMFTKSFADAWDHGSDQRGSTPFLGLYKYVKECLRQKSPAVGVSLVVTCVTTQNQAQPFYVCFACKDCFHESSLWLHFGSQKHLLHVLLYQNPWRLPLAWDNRLDFESLRSMAWEEEKERGPNEMVVKVLHIPCSLFSQLSPSYPEVMKTLVLHHTLLNCEVPRCETYSKLKQNERFPLLGQQFLVRPDMCVSHHEPIDTRYLCLLCQRMLSNDECYAHVFSREHIAAFLERFHPGSLNSSADTEAVVDLAKQAANIHSISHVQVIPLERPISEPCTYNRALSTLGGAKKRLGLGKLKPPIFPKKKLVVRETLKKESQENIRITEESEKKASQKSTYNNEKIAVEGGAEITKTHHVESGDIAGKGANKETPTPNENDSEREVVSKTSSEVKNAGSETVKEEKIEEPTMGKPAEETIENCQNTDKADETEMEEVRNKSSKEVQQLTSKEQKSCLERSSADEGESCKSSHETAEDKIPLWQYVERKSREPVIGLSALLECCCDERDPIYLCECCSLKIPEEDIISHVTGVDHQQMYLVVVDLDEEIYENISEQTFKSAIETVKALQAQNINLCELPSTSALSPVQPVDTFLTIQAQHEASSLTDDCQVEKMEMDNNSEEVQLSSVNEDVKMTQIKVSESAANANSFLAVSSRHTYTHKHKHKHKHKRTSSLQVSTSGINISRMIPDPTGEENKTEVISNTTVGQTIPSCPTTSKLREPAYNCVQTTSRATATPDPSYSTTFKPEKAPKHSETSKTGATVKMIKTSVKSENAEASAKTVPMKNSAGSNADVAPNIPTHAASHLSALVSVRPAESSPTSTSQTKTSEGPPKVGLNQLISVSCKGRRQVYCQLCSVRLKQSNHVLGLGHRYRYVQMKFPGWTAKPPALSELDKIVAYLAEKDVGSQPQRIAVDNDMYKRLSNLPEVEALEKVKEMLRHRDSHVSSFTTTDITDVSRVVSLSPCEASTPDDETKSISKEEGSLNISEPEAKDIHSDVKRAATKVKTPQSCADPVAIEEAPEMRQQQERRHDPRIQDTQKTSPVKFLNPDPTSSAASVNTELQSQSRTSQKAEHLPTPRTGHRSASQGLPRISIWKSSQGCSHLSSYLKVKGLSKEPIIGLGFVWECQGISQSTFFLCESCREMLFISDICQHVVSDKHQLKYMQSHRSQFLWFLLEEDLLLQMKQELFKDIAFMLSEQERDIDAQVVLLRQDLYEYVRTAPFSEALKLVQKIKEEPGVSVPIITLQQKDEQPEDRQCRGESFPTKKSIQALETDPRSDNEERQKTEEHNFKSTAVVGIKQRSVLSPLDLNSVSSKADSVVSLFRAAAASACPQDTCRTLLMPPELRPPVSQDLRPIPELEVKDMHSDFPSSSSVSPITSETMSVSPRNKCLPTRKRPAVTPLETLVGTCPNNSQLEHPLPAKCRCVLLQPRTESAPEFTPVNPAATSTLLSPEDKDAEPVSDKQDTSTFDWTKFAHLLALLREKKSEMRMSTYAGCPNNAGTSNSCTDRSSESGMEKSEEPKYGQTTLQDKTAKKRNRWEKWQKIKSTWENPPSTSSFEGIVSTACPSILGYENQLITPNTNSIKLPTRDELLAEKTKAVSTMLPSASNDDTSDPQHQRNVSDQSVFSTVSQVQLIPLPCVASNHNPGQIPQPQSNTETDSTQGDNLPIKAIITARPDSSEQRFVGSNVQAYTDVNRGNQVTESFSTVTTASPSDTTAASGSCGQYRQMVYITNGQVSGYLSSQAVTGYSTPDSLPVCLGNLYHCEGYPAGVFYPSQIYQGQEANRFGYSLATVMPPGLVRLGMQQQYSSWTSATLAPADGNGTNEAYLHTVPFIAEANNSQMFIAVNNNSTNRIAPQVYVTPPVIHYLPPANSEISPQTPPLTHAEGVFTVAPGPP
ncbi:uncharacterized protein LOC104922109 isoform X2 [Larimichthys crocea]|uniref:uncharacterized protein LOC104922109 isoform X2 n=1 Tax=Larimichthys crocea TaxID=215358 RepID=UPI000F5D7F39|nr:uncharacterized protein LOC104922109 isoform X2 [Larimichthys crocea]